MKLPPDVTYRQVNYWVGKGYIFPDKTKLQPGKGNHRQWTPRYTRKLWALAYLRKLGFEPATASLIADVVSAQPSSIYSFPWELGEGVTLQLVPKQLCGEWDG